MKNQTNFSSRNIVTRRFNNVVPGFAPPASLCEALRAGRTALLFGLATLVCLFIIKPAFAVDASPSASPEPVTKKYGITFPVTELGGCTSLNSCKLYCQNEANKEACTSFAKSKGFYKDPKTNDRLASLIEAAKTELGCDSEDTCKAFCQDQANFEKCVEFAKAHNINTRSNDHKKPDILAKAKEILGCDSENSCKGFCQQEANQTKCAEFAKLVGLKGGLEKRGPGGCSSEGSCKAFCSDPSHFEECSKFAQGTQFKGPGGCATKEACETFCQENPVKCKFLKNISEKIKELEEKCAVESSSDCQEFLNKDKKEKEEFCKQNPQKCQSKGLTGNGNFSLEKFCQQNPNKCKNGVPAGTSKLDGCKTDPAKCNAKEDRMKLELQRAKECKEHPEKCNKTGTNPEGIFIPKPTTSSTPPSTTSAQENSSTGDEVKGVSTSTNLLENIYNFLFKH